MLTRSEQAETDAYERRRLIDALVAEPGESHRPHGAPVLAGLVLAVLLLAGHAVRGMLAPGPPTTWSACTADGAGIAFAIPSTAHVAATADRGAVVTDGTATWLVAADAGQHAARYRVPASPAADALLATAGLPPVDQAVRVPPGWLTLFPEGGTLAPDTWVRAHWSTATLQPLAALVCAELVTDRAAPYVRLATLPPEAAWSAPPPGEVTRAVSASPDLRAEQGVPPPWLTLLGRR